MRILVIAPDHADLPNANSEIAAIDRHHDTVILRGVVNDRDVAHAVDEDDFEVIWWITHGSYQGVVLSDGILSTVGVGQYVRKSSATLCVLNTCESEDVALVIIAGGRADMICTIAPVPNRDAIRLGSLLAGELASTTDYHAAYEIVAPAGGLYRYLRSRTQYRLRSVDMLAEVREIDRRALADRQRIQIMIAALIAIVLFAAVGIYQELSEVRQNQTQIVRDIRELESRIIQLQLQHRDYGARE